MNNLYSIENLKAKCTGCVACVDACPVKCISVSYDNVGFRYSNINETKCIKCGKCYNVCPIEIKKSEPNPQHLFASYAKEKTVQNRGSSGGMFELIATYCIEKGYYVCGASFEEMVLKHKIVNDLQALKDLLKSKYIQSDTQNIFNQVVQLLKNQNKVLFCGTPCQVSALKNIVPDNLKNNLILVDIICHGVPSQKIFDMYIKELEKKHKGKIRNFSFRVKNNKYKHAHGYSYELFKNGKKKVINGIYTQSSFYNAFKKYEIFRESCYNCQYATLDRVSDLTLADFWGIEKYDFKGNVDHGVSMVITNSQKGELLFESIKSLVEYKEFPLQYGVESNHCLTKHTQKPKNRDEIIESIENLGYEATSKKYFRSGLISKIYWFIPAKMRKVIRKIRG